MAITESRSIYENPAPEPATRTDHVPGPPSLNLAAAQAAQKLRHRALSPALLAGIARLADYSALVLASSILLFHYVTRVDDIGARYVTATFLLPIAVLVLIGSFNGYSIRAYRRPVTEIGRAVGLWAAVFGCFTLVLFFLKAGDDFSRI